MLPLLFVKYELAFFDIRIYSALDWPLNAFKSIFTVCEFFIEQNEERFYDVVHGKCWNDWFFIFSLYFRPSTKNLKEILDRLE